MGPCRFSDLREELNVNSNALAINLRHLISEGKETREARSKNREDVLHMITKEGEQSLQAPQSASTEANLR
jgi:DNA-binding HxlR family transcriptional regulator